MDLIARLQSEFEANANAKNALKMKAYLKGQFDFYGLKTPLRKSIVKEVLATTGDPGDVWSVARHMFERPQREFHYTGQELLLKAKKQMREHHIEDIEWFITNNSWWDTVDHLASNVAGMYFKNWPEIQRISYCNGMLLTICGWCVRVLSFS